MEELAKRRPSDLLQFTKDYVCNMIEERNKKSTFSDS